MSNSTREMKVSEVMECAEVGFLAAAILAGGDGDERY